jgi:hypothetical protein
VTVGTEQDAFPCFGTERVESHPESLSADDHALLGRIEMMELESRRVPVVSASHTGPTGLAHEEELDPTPAPSHGVRSATAAAVSAIPVKHELGGSVL